jgi:hypothetical protein
VKPSLSILAVALVAGSLSACSPSTGVVGTNPPPSIAASVDSGPDASPIIDQLPAIFVNRPASGAAIGNPARVAGSADVFEATFRVTLLDGRGQTLVDQQVMATCGSGCRGTFDVMLRYDVPEAQWGTLRAWDGSAKDGTPENVREYPVWLTPAS